jgi:microsomal dipeptidase-like Zn-dependent dipeptidase
MPPVSKIARMPAAVRQALERALVQHAYGDIEEVTAWLNERLAAEGVQLTVGKSAVGEYSKRIKRAQESIAAATEAARLIADTAPDREDKRSAGAMALITSEIFDVLLDVQQSQDIEDPVQRLKVMGEAGLAMSRISRANVNSLKWAAEVEAKAKAAATAVDKIVKSGGLSQEQAAEIRAQIMGIAAVQAPAAAAPATT